MKILSSYFLLGLLLIISCSSLKQGTLSERQKARLNGKWELVQLLDIKNVDTLYAEQLPVMVLSPQENKVTGNSGCNSFFGSIELTDSEIKFGQMGSTKRFCSEVPETEFFDALGRVSKYRFKGKMLELVADGKVLMVFEKIEDLN